MRRMDKVRVEVGMKERFKKKLVRSRFIRVCPDQTSLMGKYMTDGF